MWTWTQLIFSLLHTGLVGMLLFGSPEDLLIHNCHDVYQTIPENKLCWVQSEELRPSQFALGMWEVNTSVEKIENYSWSALRRLKMRWPVPINIAPTGEFFVINRHHTVRALLDSKVDWEDKWVFCKVNRNWNELKSMNSFYRAAMAEGNMWLYDNKGIGPLDPHLLPTHFKDMEDDIFRTISALAKNNGCWKGHYGIPFIEFMWAEYFRSKLGKLFDLHRIHRADIDDWCSVRPYSDTCIFDYKEMLTILITEALNHCFDPEAQTLPGYKAIENN